MLFVIFFIVYLFLGVLAWADEKYRTPHTLLRVQIYVMDEKYMFDAGVKPNVFSALDTLQRGGASAKEISDAINTVDDFARKLRNIQAGRI